MNKRRKDIGITESEKKLFDSLKPKLNPCPNCASTRLIINKSFFKPHSWFVECHDCHWCGETKWRLRRAVKAWNKEVAESDSSRA